MSPGDGGKDALLLDMAFRSCSSIGRSSAIYLFFAASAFLRVAAFCRSAFPSVSGKRYKWRYS